MYTNDQRMTDALLCAAIVFPIQSAKTTSMYVDIYCNIHPDMCKMAYSADYDLIDLNSELRFASEAGTYIGDSGKAL